MDKVTGLTRNSEGDFVRGPDIAKIIRNNKSTLYRDPLNKRLFPDGSIIAGFWRRKNLSEMVAPTTPRCVARA